jgi:Mn2+/Fe2+ NRAMP family transporter
MQIANIGSSRCRSVCAITATTIRLWRTTASYADSASTAYAVGECVGVTHSFNSTPRRAVLFYASNIAAALIAAGIILIPGAPLLSIALNANVLATVLLPMALIFLIMLANDRDLMGEWTNKPSTNKIAIAIVAFISICGAAYGIDSFLQATHLIPAG